MQWISSSLELSRTAYGSKCSVFLDLYLRYPLHCE